MEENLQQLKCGQCGMDKHNLYIRPNGTIIAECVSCKSTSEIAVWSDTKIKISNHSGLGTLCTFK